MFKSDLEETLIGLFQEHPLDEMVQALSAVSHVLAGETDNVDNEAENEEGYPVANGYQALHETLDELVRTEYALPQAA